MQLLSVEGSNVGLLRGKFKFDFDASLTVITGPIGCGKSTILTMVKGSLTNTFPGTASSWASWGIAPQEASYFVVTWKIGGKTLRIAKCLANDKVFQGLNIPRLTIEHEDGKVEELHGSKESLERAQGMIPIPPSIIDGHLVVDQDSITAPVSSTASKFKETIHILTRADELDGIRQQLRDFLSTLSVPEVEQELAETTTTYGLVSGELAALRTEEQTAKAQLDAMELGVVHDKLNELEQAKRNKDRVEQLQNSCVSNRNAMRNYQQSLVAVEQQLVTATKVVTDSKEAYTAALGLCAQASSMQARKQRHDALVGVVKSNQFQLSRLDDTEPAKPRPTSEDFKSVELADIECKTSMLELERKLRLAEARLCPECGNPTELTQEALAELQTSLETTRTVRQELTQLRKEADDLLKEWDRWQEVRRSKDALQQRIDQCNEELATLQDVADYDIGVAAEASSIVQKYDEAVKLVQRLTHEKSTLESRCAVVAHAVQQEQQEIDALSKTVYDYNLHMRLTDVVNRARQLMDSIMLFQGQQQAKQAEIIRLEHRLASLKQRHDQVAPIRKARAVLARATDLLVKDALPKAMSMQYMTRLNERIKHYLEMINAEFTAFIDDNLDFMARKHDGLVHKASRLSGGQRQQASVCYLLAVNDVFASTLGVLALDEPTGAMQESNTRDMAEAFNSLAQLGMQSGRQFIVVTHSPTLAAYGGKVIALEGSY